MQTLNEDIKTRQFKPAYLLFGEEAFLIQSYKKKLREAITGGDTMNVHSFQGKGPDIKEIISLGDTMPFFSEKRLILIEDSGFFKAAADELAAWLPTMPGTTCLLFVEEAVDKRSKLYKRVKELGYAAEMKRQDSAQLARWAASILARNGRKVTGATMNLFLERIGDDMEQIWMELEKLISYTMGSDVVTPEDVKAITSVQVSNRIFEMVNAMVAGNTKQAMGLFQDLLSLKEPPMRVLFLIARQFNQLLQVKELTEQKKGRGEIASQLKVPPFVAGKLSAQAGVFSKKELLDLVNLCVEAEEAVKTGLMDGRLAVELLLVGRGKGRPAAARMI